MNHRKTKRNNTENIGAVKSGRSGRPQSVVLTTFVKNLPQMGETIPKKSGRKEV